MPAWVAALLLAICGAALVLVALLAGRAGALVAHPPTQPPPQPPTRTAPMMTLPTMPSMPPMPQQGRPSGAWLWWVAAVIAALVVIFLVLALVRALRRPGRIAAPPVAPPGAALSPMALGRLGEEAEADRTDDRTFDPRRAADDIIVSWEAVESAAAALGLGRSPASTPTEFLAALADRLGDPEPPVPPDGPVPPGGPVPTGWRGPSDAASVLLGLYHRARFDTRVLAPGEATAARRAARTLIEGWTSARRRGSRGPGGGADPRGQRATPGGSP